MRLGNSASTREPQPSGMELKQHFMEVFCDILDSINFAWTVKSHLSSLPQKELGGLALGFYSRKA